MDEMTNSHILVHEFEYVEPTSVEEAVALLGEYGGRAQVLAGGTYLLVQMKMERTAPEYVINVARIPGLDGIALQDCAREYTAREYTAREYTGVRIGALTTIRALRQAPQVWADYTALAEACASFGSTQIQMMGTLGGNVCNGSPASDTVPALVVFGAQLVLAGPAGERIVPVEEFLLGPGQTALRDDELLVAVDLPTFPKAPSFREGPAICNPQSAIGSAFIKLSRVAADLAKASVAAVVVREGERIAQCRLAFGSVGPTVLRTPRAEAVLAGQPFSTELALEAGRVAAEEISPIDDVRSTAWYRREVVKVLAHDVLCKAWERAGRQGDKETRRQGDTETRRHGDTEAENEGQDLADYASRFTSHVSRSTEHGTRNTKHVPRDAQREIELTVNGVKHRLSVAPNELLLNVLRERLELTGAKYGCGIGECGACTVHLNGTPVLACLVLAIAADGGKVLTVEGLQHADGALDPLQEAFIEHSAFQCGYCTPGMLMMSKGLLSETPAPTEDEIRDYLKGNRCRCTGFVSIVRAVMSCAQERGD